MVVHACSPITWEAEAGRPKAENLTGLRRARSCLKKRTKPALLFFFFLQSFSSFLDTVCLWTKEYGKDGQKYGCLEISSKYIPKAKSSSSRYSFVFIPSSHATLKQKGIEACAAAFLMPGCHGTHPSSGSGIKLHHSRTVILNLVMLLCLLVLSYWTLF